jgi:iron complex outermembrane recepter protein
MKSRRKTLDGRTLSIAAAIAALLHGGGATADQTPATDSGVLEEIVITAEKHPERLSDVPVSAAVVSAQMLANTDSSDISDINKLVPSVNLNGTFNGRVPMGIRGVSSVSNEGTVGLSSGVAILIDGVPVPSDSLAGNQLDDAQNVEVLKGPQATLGGRTAASGVINIVTRGPTDTFTGDISGTATSDDEFRLNGFLSGPITQGLDFSLSAYDSEIRYPILNTQLDRWSTQRVSGARAKLLFKPNDDLNITLTAHYGRMTSDGFNLVYTYLTPGTTLLVGPGGPPFLSPSALLPGITPGFGNKYYNSPLDVGSKYEDKDVSLNVDYHIGGLTFGSVTAFQHETQAYQQDLFAVSSFFWNELTGGHAPPFNNQQDLDTTVQQLSQEFKLASATDQPFSYLVGAFYSDTKVHEQESRNLLPAYNDTDIAPDTKTSDLYGRTTWKFLPDTSLVTSLRYNYDQLRYNVYQALYTYSVKPAPDIGANQFATGRTNSSNVVGDISLKQQLTPDIMAYFTYARGYSPEAYNTTQAISSNPAQAKSSLQLAPTERINHFEIGTKGAYFDHTLTANVALFWTIYRNFQVQNFDQSSAAINPPLILESADAQTKGVEFDTQWAPARDTRIGFSAAYIDATFKDYKNAPCYYPDSVAVTVPAGCVQQTNGLVTNNVWSNLNGKPMPNAPKVKLALNADQHMPLGFAPYDVVFGGTLSYRDKAQMLADQNPQTINPSATLLGLRVGLASQSGKFTVTAFVNNLLNQHYATDLEDFWSAPWGAHDVVVMQPARDSYRYGGVRFTAGF